jgi:hypothetical protein
VSPRREAKADILVGGWQVAASPTIVGNFSYYGAGDEGRGADVGYRAGCTGARIEGNYLAGGTPLRLRRCDDATITGNRLYGHVADDLAESFPHNEYSASPPERNDVFVLPNAFEHGRATVVVFNWERRRSIQADISAAGFVNGETIVVRDVQDYFGSPVAELSYRTGEPLDIPLGAASAASPIGGAPVAHTPLTFAVFSVERRPATEGDIPQLSPCGGRGERP